MAGISEGGIYPGTKVRGNGKTHSKYLNVKNLKVTTRSLMRTIKDVMFYLGSKADTIKGLSDHPENSRLFDSEGKPNADAFRAWVGEKLEIIKTGRIEKHMHGGKEFYTLNAISGYFKSGNDRIIIPDEFYAKNMEYLTKNMPKKTLESIVRSIADFAMEYSQKRYTLANPVEPYTWGFADTPDAQKVESYLRNVGKLQDRYLVKIEKLIDPTINPAAARRAFSALEKARQYMGLPASNTRKSKRASRRSAAGEKTMPAKVGTRVETDARVPGEIKTKDVKAKDVKKAPEVKLRGLPKR